MVRDLRSKNEALIRLATFKSRSGIKDVESEIFKNPKKNHGYQLAELKMLQALLIRILRLLRTLNADIAQNFEVVQNSEGRKVIIKAFVSVFRSVFASPFDT